VSLTERDSTNIYLMDAKSGASRPVRFTFERSIDRSPIWSRDGSRVLFTRAALGLFEKPVNGAGPERLLIQPGERPTDWSRNGTIVYSRGGHIMLFADGKPVQFTKTDFVEQFARLSPDGSLIAYTSNDSRHVFDVWVETVPAGSKWQPSPDGGFQPRWSPDGRELFYLRYKDATLMAVPVAPGPRFGAPVELFTIPKGGLDRGFAVSADGRQFLIPTFASGASAPVTVITNWTPMP
jgi:dipeptidyl aminopeptidase/acylaminoacyl peptidase